MLLELHVKNLALIEQVDLEFFAGLTVLSGETGAGKSILIDSINLALGAKVGKDVVRAGADFAYIELLFCINDRLKLDAIRKMDIEVGEDGLITMSRKISKQKNVLRINGEVIAAAKGRKLMSLLIDIHSQHESYGLLEVSKQLQLIDLFAEDRVKEVKNDIKEEYQKYKAIEEKLSETLEENLRRREVEFLKYEIEEQDINTAYNILVFRELMENGEKKEVYGNIISENVKRKTAIELEEHSDKIKGLYVITNSNRTYLRGSEASHIIRIYIKNK